MRGFEPLQSVLRMLLTLSVLMGCAGKAQSSSVAPDAGETKDAGPDGAVGGAPASGGTFGAVGGAPASGGTFGAGGTGSGTGGVPTGGAGGRAGGSWGGGAPDGGVTGSGGQQGVCCSSVTDAQECRAAQQCSVVVDAQGTERCVDAQGTADVYVDEVGECEDFERGCATAGWTLAAEGCQNLDEAACGHDCCKPIVNNLDQFLGCGHVASVTKTRCYQAPNSERVFLVEITPPSDWIECSFTCEELDQTLCANAVECSVVTDPATNDFLGCIDAN